jgi:hypothetical protein
MWRYAACGWLTAAIIFVYPALAQFTGELLITPAIPNYTPAPETMTSGGFLQQQFLPNQNADNWTETLSIQGLKDPQPAPSDYEATQIRAWMPNCQSDVTTQELSKDVEKGYPSVTWQVGCANNPATGKPEYGWFKAIKGSQMLSIVSRSFRYNLSAEQVSQVVQYLKGVTICNYATEHDCPKIVVPAPGAAPTSSVPTPASPPAANPQ